MFWCNYGRLWFTECKIARWYQHHGQLMKVVEVGVWAWCQHQLAHQHFGFHWLEALLVFSHLPVHFRTFRRRRLHGSAVSSVKYLVVGGVGFPLLLSSCRRPFPLFTLHSSLDKLNIYTACLLTPRVHSGRRVANPHVASVNVTTSPTACKLLRFQPGCSFGPKFWPIRCFCRSDIPIHDAVLSTDRPVSLMDLVRFV